MSAPETKQIEIVVNGRPRRIDQALNLIDLLAALNLDPARVAVELNRSIVPRKDWDKTIVGEQAALEIVQFVGGG